MTGEKLRIIPLGGVEEIGINCTAFEYKHQVVVVDMGLGFPEKDMYGVDYVIPNVDYLTNRKNKIEGIVITHGHLDHIGALPYTMERLGFPDIWGTEFTVELIRSKLEEHKLDHKVKLHVINENSHLNADNFSLSFFRVNHSIPQCVGVVIKTPAATAVHTGDFKFDNSPVNEPVADYARMAQIGEAGVDILLSDSTNSLRKGHPVSESEVADNLRQIVENAPGRVVVATFSGLVGRLYQLIKIAEQLDRKVAIAGYSMRKTIEIAKSIGYLETKHDTFVPIQKVNRYNDENIMILTTGSQGEANAALSRMAGEGYKNIEIKKGDTVIISAGTIPGNDVDVQNLIDSLSAKDAIVHASEVVDFFTSGHGYQEDQKIMLNLIKPKYFMPVHGYQYFLKEHGRTAQTTGVPEENIIIPKRGSIVEGNAQSGFTITGNTKSYPLLVSGLGVGDVGAAVLAERKQLGHFGVLVINISLDMDKRELSKPIEVINKGFVYVKSSRDILEEIQKLAAEEVEKAMKRYYGQDRLGENIEKVVRKYVNAEIQRDPVILPIITSI